MKVFQEDGGDFFYSFINIDIIDGIICLYIYFIGFFLVYLMLVIVCVLFISGLLKDYRILDDFWMMKEWVYLGLINDEIGFVFDKMSEIFFLELLVCLSESDLYKSEKSWQQIYKFLFVCLNSILKKKFVLSWFLNV